MIKGFREFQPQLGNEVFVAPTAVVVGQVVLGDGASVWYGTVVRGDVGTIQVGARTNLQDLTVVHVTGGQFDTWIGQDVTVGHRAILHGCKIEDRVLIGMGAIVLDGAHVGADSVVAAGALVTPNTTIPPGSMVMGAPAKVVRPVSDAEREWTRASAEHYVMLAKEHAAL